MTRGKHIAVGCALPLAAFYVIGCYGCSTGAQATSPPDAAADARPRVDAGLPYEAGPDPDGGPVFGPDGWIRDDSFDPTCGFYVPPSKDKLPPPIAWEACDPSMSPAGITCRQMALNWPPTSDGQSLSAPVFGSMTDGDGGITLQVTRFTGSYGYRLVAEADGPVHQAVLETSIHCTLEKSSLKDHKVVYVANHMAPGGLGSVRFGAIGGDIDDLQPRTLRNYATTGDRPTPDYLAGATVFFENGNGLNLYSWTDGSLLQGLSLSVSDPQQVGEYSYQGDALFLTASNANYSRIKIFTPANGTRDFISFGNVISNSAADFGTDGVNMVWIEASGRSTSTDPWAAFNIMTAPYTTDPSAIVKRRVRSEDRGYFGTVEFSVGCGYAAQEFLTPGIGAGVRIVRLSDGVSWKLSDKTPWHWNGPTALTCNELFVNVVKGSEFNIARVRLDSLGPGIPPD